MKTKRICCFKAYDIRGKVPDDLDEGLAYRIGRAYAEYLTPGTVVVGRDVRLSSGAIAGALIDGLIDSGVTVFDIGLCGTEQVYFSTTHLKAGGGVMVTASHNPSSYNGMKLVRERSLPISGDTGLLDIEALTAAGVFRPVGDMGEVRLVDTREAYAEHILSYINTPDIPPYKVVVNPGNGCAGPVLDLLGKHLPFEFVKVHYEPDGSFPNGVPNPLLPENREATAKAVRQSGADIGLAWDGDFDRCFFFDETGGFVESYYIVGLLAEAILKARPGSKIVHDPRLTWNTLDITCAYCGIPVMSKTGHAFIKERMRAEDAAYGGEMSAHHYFREFSYCDSGMIPWLLVLDLMARTGKPLSALIAERERLYPVSGEINLEVADPETALTMVEKVYAPLAFSVDHTDGVSMEFAAWRFNLRMSNTEPLVRLNVESFKDKQLMEEKTRELLGCLNSCCHYVM